MDLELFECELLKKQLKKEEMLFVSKTHSFPADPIILNDHSKLRYLEKIMHPKSNPQLKLLEKIDLLKDSKDERLHYYFNKIIRNIKNGKLELH